MLTGSLTVSNVNELVIVLKVNGSSQPTQYGTVTGLSAANGILTPAAINFPASVSYPGTAASGTGWLYANSTNGSVLYGNGAGYDVYIGNRTGALALAVSANTANVVFGGILTQTQAATGTIASFGTTTSTGNAWVTISNVSNAYNLGNDNTATYPGYLFSGSGFRFICAINFTTTTLFNGVATFSVTPTAPGLNTPLSNLGTVGATATVNFSASAIVTLTTTASTNLTLSFTAPAGPGDLYLRITAAATGTTVTLTWPASVKGTPPATATTAKASMLNFIYDGTNYWYVSGLLNV